MKIYALTTGTVSVKHSFLFPRDGARRQLDLFPPGAFSEPLPIHCWAIEHDGVLRLVDTGETAAARNVPFAQMHVTPEQELPAAMAGRAWNSMTSRKWCSLTPTATIWTGWSMSAAGS